MEVRAASAYSGAFRVVARIRIALNAKLLPEALILTTRTSDFGTHTQQMTQRRGRQRLDLFQQLHLYVGGDPRQVRRVFIAGSNKAGVLRAVTEEHLRHSGVKIKVDHGVDNMAMAMSLVASTRGWH